MKKDEFGRNPAGFFNKENDTSKAISFITKHLQFFHDYAIEFDDIKELVENLNSGSYLFEEMKDAYEQHIDASAVWSQGQLTDAINNYFWTQQTKDLVAYFEGNPSMAKVIASCAEDDPILLAWASKKGVNTTPTAPVIPKETNEPSVDPRTKAINLIRFHTAFFIAFSNPINQELKLLADQYNITESPLLDAMRNAFHHDTDRASPGWQSARKFRHAIEHFKDTGNLGQMYGYFKTNPTMYEAIANHATDKPNANNNDPLFAAWMELEKNPDEFLRLSPK